MNMKLLIIYDEVGRIYFQASGDDFTVPTGVLTVKQMDTDSDKFPISIDVETGNPIYQPEA